MFDAVVVDEMAREQGAERAGAPGDEHRAVGRHGCGRVRTSFPTCRALARRERLAGLVECRTG